MLPTRASEHNAEGGTAALKRSDSQRRSLRHKRLPQPGADRRVKFSRRRIASGPSNDWEVALLNGSVLALEQGSPIDVSEAWATQRCLCANSRMKSLYWKCVRNKFSSNCSGYRGAPATPSWHGRTWTRMCKDLWSSKVSVIGC